MAIDFNKIAESTKENLSLVASLFTPEHIKNEQTNKHIREVGERFYRTKGPHNDTRQLHMLNMIMSPIRRAGFDAGVRQITEMGGGYQPDTTVPLVFIPQYNDHIDLCYKGTKIFDLEFSPNGGRLLRARIPNFEAKQRLGNTPNAEWDMVAEKIAKAVEFDRTRDRDSVMYEKTDTLYLRQVQATIKSNNGERVNVSDVFVDPPVNSGSPERISDDDLERMCNAMMQNIEPTTTSDDMEFGG